jgi:ABC-type antimicrobial peptide transport system permease subunit
MDENEWELRNNKNLYRKSPNPLVFLYNFIMNNIPSMIYLNQNKKYLKFDSC